MLLYINFQNNLENIILITYKYQQKLIILFDFLILKIKIIYLSLYVYKITLYSLLKISLKLIMLFFLISYIDEIKILIKSEKMFQLILNHHIVISFFKMKKEIYKTVSNVLLSLYQFSNTLNNSFFFIIQYILIIQVINL